MANIKVSTVQTILSRLKIFKKITVIFPDKNISFVK